MQSTVYIVDSLIKFILNKANCSRMVIYALPFVPYFPELTGLLRAGAEAISHLEMTLLAIFNLYRMAVIVRPRFTILWYALVVVITTVSYTISLVSGFTHSARLRQISILLCALNALPTIICYTIIRRHFRGISSSDSVKRMQSKLSVGLLLELTLQLINSFIRWSAFVFLWFDLYSDSDIIAAISIYFQISDMFLAWMPALIGLLIKWSISGFLRTKKTHTERLSLSNISLQQKWLLILRSKLSRRRGSSAVGKCSKVTKW
ncbi:hypothetical protein Aduo_007076 [Ancylostoma duodenale]